ncbi:HpcH/HpaI aldolase/citrate lyase family protein [Candidatus Margulisiibacteriota bacterium]
MENKFKRRRTMLYIPGNNPGMLQQGGVYGADGLLLDIEDSVALNQKDAARILIRNMLKTINFYDSEVTVRINSLDTPFGQVDLEEIVPLQPDAVRVPKVESKEDVDKVIKIIEKIEKKHKLPHNKMSIHPLIETALGVHNAFEIASASPRVDAISIGGQDLTADMNIAKTKDGAGIDYARKRIVLAAKACHIDVLDTIYADVDDDEGLREETEYIKKIGFTGKAVINPRQIDIIHDVFTPKEEEVRKALKIIKAYQEHKEQGIGVFALDGKMIDAPVVARARHVLVLAGFDEKDINK